MQAYVDETPERLNFPNSGAGIGNVWKIRVDGCGGYRAIYFAYPKTREFYSILIYAEKHRANLTNEQVKQVRKFVKRLEEIIEEEP